MYIILYHTIIENIKMSKYNWPWFQLPTWYDHHFLIHVLWHPSLQIGYDWNSKSDKCRKKRQKKPSLEAYTESLRNCYLWRHTLHLLCHNLLKKCCDTSTKFTTNQNNGLYGMLWSRKTETNQKNWKCLQN